LISNSNFKIQFEFEKVFNIKLVDLEILKISYFENFSSYYMILGVIWQNSLKLKLGELQYWANGGLVPRGMGAEAPPWPSRPFSRVQDRQHDVAHLPVWSRCLLLYID
jgi:hypothetical protein